MWPVIVWQLMSTFFIFLFILSFFIVWGYVHGIPIWQNTNSYYNDEKVKFYLTNSTVKNYRLSFRYTIYRLVCIVHWVIAKRKNVTFGFIETNADIAFVVIVVTVQTHAYRKLLHQHIVIAPKTCIYVFPTISMYRTGPTIEWIEPDIEWFSHYTECATSNGSAQSVNTDEHSGDVCAATGGMGCRTNGKIRSRSRAGIEYFIADHRFRQICAKFERNCNWCTKTKCNHRGQCHTQHRWRSLFTYFRSI